MQERDKSVTKHCQDYYGSLLKLERNDGAGHIWFFDAFTDNWYLNNTQCIG